MGHSAKRPGHSRVNAQNPSHDGGAKLRSRQRDTRTNDRALLRRCSLLSNPEGHSRPVRPYVPLTRGINVIRIVSYGSRGDVFADAVRRRLGAQGAS